MKRTVIFFVFLFFSNTLFQSFSSEIICKIKIENDTRFNKQNEPVVISISDLFASFPTMSATVYDNDVEIPSQLDDLNEDGIYDEVAWVTDIQANSTKEFTVHFSSEKIEKNYPGKVHAQMWLREPKGKHAPMTSLTVPGKSDVYNLLHHHGAAFESELVAYRIYFDRKQTVDIYGKFHKQLELAESLFYPTKEQLENGFGDDVLRVSGSAGLGTLKGWNGTKAIHIEPVKTRTQTIRATGPIRTIVDMTVRGWKYNNSEIDMTTRYILYAGHRDCEVHVFFNRPIEKQVFCIGIQNIIDSVKDSDGKGLLACWGTDWPVNDTITYAKETVGLAISIPEEIVMEEKQDAKVNYLYTIQPKGKTEFTYNIMFTSRKETFGYQTMEEWFSYAKTWKQQLAGKLKIEVLSKQESK